MSKQKFLICFLLCCLVPLVAAWVVLKAGWFEAGVNSHGRWMKTEIKLLPAVPTRQAHWRLVFIAPEQCEQSCQQALHLMQQIHTALGRKQQQLDLVVVAPAAATGIDSSIPVQQVDAQGIPVGHFVVVEQQGIALLEYSLPTDATELALTGKAVMSDLKKLMSYDRGPV